MEGDLQSWRARVRESVGDDPFVALAHDTLEGLQVLPLYTAGAPAPGQRGSGGFATTPFVTSAAELESAYAGGASGVWMDEDTFERLPSVPAEGVVIVDFTMVPDAMGVLAGRAAPTLLAVDAFTRLGQGGTMLSQMAYDLGDFIAQAEAEVPGLRAAALVSAVEVHDSGCDRALELGLLASGVLELLRWGERAGFDPSVIAERIALRIAVGEDVFLEIAKLRALRVLWQRILTASGASAPPAFVHAVTSQRTMARRDPWTNALRNTTQAFAAAVGGADAISVRPHDTLDGGSDEGRRLARNTTLILAEEAHLGQISDLAAGSYAIETLTDQLARAGWTLMRQIEQQGGIIAALSGRFVLRQVEEARAARGRAIRTRQTPLVGVSVHPPTEIGAPVGAPASGRLPARRDSAHFEELVAEMAALRSAHVLLVPVGDGRGAAAPLAHAADLFAAAGVRTTTSSSVQAGGRVATEGAKVVCLCGSEESLKVVAPDLVPALRASGVAKVCVAGAAPDGVPIDGVVHPRVDVPELVRGLAACWRA